MLFYIRCPTCGRVISTNLDKYQAEIDALINNPRKTKKEKDIEGSKLLDKYGFKHICCRIRIMGLIPYHRIVQS